MWGRGGVKVWCGYVVCMYVCSKRGGGGIWVWVWVWVWCGRVWYGYDMGII